MHIFYDVCTKFIAVYFGKATTAEEYLCVCKQFIADYKQYLPCRHVAEFYADGGPESKGGMEEFCTKMATHCRFIPLWNPSMNVSETGWRIILRPLCVVHTCAILEIDCAYFVHGLCGFCNPTVRFEKYEGAIWKYDCAI